MPNDRPIWPYGLIILLFFIIVAACSITSRGPTRTSPEPTATSASGNEARVSQVEIRKQEPLPLKVSAVIRGDLPDQCVQVERIEQQRTNTIFDLKVITRRLDNIACTGQPQPFEETVSLQVDGLTAGSYTVMAEGVTGAGNLFNLLVDNVEPTPTPSYGIIEGVIWRDGCRLTETPATVSNCRSPRAEPPNGQIDDDEPRLAGLSVSLTAGACLSIAATATDVVTATATLTATAAETIATMTTGADGLFRFRQLPPGAYCLLVDSQAPANAALLRGGDWTAPAPGANRVPLDLAAGETKTLNFGWNRRSSSLSASGELCRDRATYVADVTIPDDTILAPAETFTKTWRIRNEGNCAWSGGYSLVFSGQEPLRAETTRLLTMLVRPGDETELSIDLVAPEKVGTYRSNWALQDEESQTFGSFYVQIVVKEKTPEKK